MQVAPREVGQTRSMVTVNDRFVRIVGHGKVNLVHLAGCGLFLHISECGVGCCLGNSVNIGDHNAHCERYGITAVERSHPIRTTMQGTNNELRGKQRPAIQF